MARIYHVAGGLGYYAVVGLDGSSNSYHGNAVFEAPSLQQLFEPLVEARADSKEVYYRAHSQQGEESHDLWLLEVALGCYAMYSLHLDGDGALARRESQLFIYSIESYLPVLSS
ncbi:MAG: hypothetical protein QXU97_03375 [Fervidicoccaceae archaeon]